MRLIKPIKILIFILPLLGTSLAQNSEPRFVQLPMEKGIALNLTYDMMQDRKGFLWFETMYGLVRYDGENFITYKYNPEDSTSISFNDIISLFEDSKGNLWVGTWGGGINKFDVNTNKFTRFLHDPTNLQSVADNIIWSICEDNSGKIWLGTNSHGLQSYDPASGLFKKTDLELADSTNVFPSIHCLLADGNFLWIGHSKGLSKLNLEKGSFLQFDLSEENDKTTGMNFIHSIYKDLKNNLWIGTSSGLKKYDPNEHKFIQFDSDIKNSITSITEDKNGFLWLGSNNGIFMLNTETGESKKFTAGSDKNSIAGNFVNKVLVDKSGLLWISSYNSGVTKAILTQSNFKRYPDITEDSKPSLKENITAITGDNKGNIYVGTYSNKIQIFNKGKEENSVITLPDKEGSTIHSLVANKNNLWIGTNRTLLKYDLDKKRFENITLPKEQKNEIEGNVITALCFNTDSTLWIGTYNQGVYCLNLIQKELKHYSLVNDQKPDQANFIITIYTDSKNDLWIGTYGGVYQLNFEGKIINSLVQQKNNPKGLSNNYVYTILEDADGDYWFGTASGLNKFDFKTKSFKHFYNKDGLPGDVIFGMVQENPEMLWISTNKGISRFIPEKNSFVNFDEEDGLQGDVFNPSVYFKSNDGTIYFGGLNGLTYFSPGELKFSSFNPPIEITSIKIKNEDGDLFYVNPQIGEFDLEPNQNTITIEFASLDFTNPDKIQYRYKLSGLSDEWISLGSQNSVTFSKLKNGDYSFQLMGTNSDGVWSEKTAALGFTIPPHFWQTWWFIPSIIAGLLLITLLTIYIILRIKVQRAVEIMRIREEESERVRKKTAIDFHDELGHRLTRISLLTEIIKRKIGFSFSDLRPLLDQISENSAKLYDGTKDFIWAIDPQKDSLYELVVRLKDFGDEIFSSTEINFNVEGISDELQKATLDMDLKRHLMLIFKEGMNNSLKHSKGTKVTLTSNMKDDEFELVLEDDGKGFEPTENIKGNGLKNMQQRAANLNANIQIDSQPGNGTKLSFKGKFPIKSVNFN